MKYGNHFTDILLTPRQFLANKNQAIILKYKYTENERDLAKAAQEALQQITTKKYVGKLKSFSYDYVKTVLKIRIAFHKKEVEIDHKVEKL